MNPRTHFLSVAGINSKDGVIKPFGNHLRWTFPAELGFPSGGFEVFRRNAMLKPAGLFKLNIKKLNDSPQVAQNGATLESARRNPITLRFSDPIVFIFFEFTNSNQPIDICAYGSSGKIIERQTVDIQHNSAVFYFPGITHLDATVSLENISDIIFQTLTDALDDQGWESVKKLEMLRQGQVTEAIDRLSGVQNYHAKNQASAADKYRSGISQLLNWQQLVTQVTAPQLVQQPGKISDETGTRGARIGVLSSLMLAALDPNVARILTLYWVDPKPGLYDYKVCGYWRGHSGIDFVDGLTLALGNEDSVSPPGLPILMDEDMKRCCWQLPGISWKNMKPRARMALRWLEPPAPAKAAAHAAQPVFYEVVRKNDGLNLTSDRLAFVTNQGRRQLHQPWLIDPSVPMGDVGYHVSGVDIFGRKGKARHLFGKAQENVTPPPPIRLRCDLSSTQNMLTGTFEYGAMQHAQAPDVIGFELLWRPNSPARRERVLMERVRVEENDEGTFFTSIVRVSTAAGQAFAASDLLNFEGGVVETPRRIGDAVTPAAQRYTWRIIKVELTGLLHLTSASVQSPSGTRELVADVHHRGNWTSLPAGGGLQVNAPLKGEIADISQIFTVSVTGVEAVPPPALPSFDAIPTALRPSITPSDDSIAAMQALTVDRIIIDPSHFGRVTKTGTNESIPIQSFPIHAVLPPQSSGVGSVVRIGSDHPHAVGDRLVLRAPVSLVSDSKVVVLLINPQGPRAQDWIVDTGGELEFSSVDDFNGETEILGIARLIAVSVIQGTLISVVVSVPSLLEQQLGSGISVRYFRPYRFSVPVVLDDVTEPSDISLPFAGDDAVRTGFVAVCAKRGPPLHMTGPLCASVAFTAIRPALAVTPSAPYPAGQRTALEGFASAPDSEGRCIIRLKWDLPAPSNTVVLRYEVARALGTAIPVAHRRNWLCGTADDDANLIRPGTRVAGVLDTLHHDESGLFKATFTPAMLPADGVDFRGGRLKHVVEIGVNGAISKKTHFFEITFATRKNGLFRFLLRAVGQNAASLTDETEIQAAPEYTQMLEDKAALRAVAAQTPDAFSVVTGSPLADTTFLDEVARLTTGAFFYRVRAVDPAGNATVWSPVSVPFRGFRN